MTLDEMIVAAQGLVDALTALKNTPPAGPAATVTEVDVKESDGTEEKFVPEAPAA